MPEQDSVKILMNPRVMSVLPDTPIVTAIDILLSNNYNGVPVTDKSGVLVGILTKYDIILKRSSVRDDTKAKDLMNADPLFLTEEMTVEDAVRAFTEHHKVDPIPVIDANKKVVGIISRYDMVKMFREYGTAFEAKEDRINTENKKSPILWIIIILSGLLLAGAYYFGFLNRFL